MTDDLPARYNGFTGDEKSVIDSTWHSMWLVVLVTCSLAMAFFSLFFSNLVINNGSGLCIYIYVLTLLSLTYSLSCRHTFTEHFKIVTESNIHSTFFTNLVINNGSELYIYTYIRPDSSFLSLHIHWTFKDKSGRRHSLSFFSSLICNDEWRLRFIHS